MPRSPFFAPIISVIDKKNSTFVDYFETPLDGSSRGSELITKD